MRGDLRVAVEPEREARVGGAVGVGHRDLSTGGSGTRFAGAVGEPVATAALDHDVVDQRLSIIPRRETYSESWVASNRPAAGGSGGGATRTGPLWRSGGGGDVDLVGHPLRERLDVLAQHPPGDTAASRLRKASTTGACISAISRQLGPVLDQRDQRARLDAQRAPHLSAAVSLPERLDDDAVETHVVDEEHVRDVAGRRRRRASRRSRPRARRRSPSSAAARSRAAILFDGRADRVDLRELARGDLAHAGAAEAARRRPCRGSRARASPRARAPC